MMDRLLKEQTTLLAASFLFTALTATGAAAGGQQICQQELQQTIRSLDTGALTISKISISDVIKTHRSGNHTVGAEAWVSFNECTGNLVIRTNTSCAVRSIYTRGSCQIQGVDHY
ncbi:hypothetical protein [Sneathiella chinensis]|uniref:Uncharacterized protein n=1 Tax=Sneathiella chinensis TaxID=349750 RepID=A0ABQ5U416_9PROT|nr:hypothetical protein [Sneathiella chinensis]GLQ06659.1 hypothetical protein GCM10007924_18800 [Sneathiella chinensis]